MHPDRRRNLIVALLLCTLFVVLLFAKLSVLQAYVIAGTFFAMGIYAIVLGFRD
jgi:Ca2+/Na+ antiporter